MAADRADEDNLKVTSLGAGEWGDMPVPLAMDYDLVAETPGTAAVPLGMVAPLTLVSLAFIIGELDKADDLLATWEAAIVARGAQAATGDVAANARAAAMAVCDAVVGGLVTGTAAGQYGRPERPAIQAPGAPRRRARIDAYRAHPLFGDAAQRRAAERRRRLGNGAS